MPSVENHRHIQRDTYSRRIGHDGFLGHARFRVTFDSFGREIEPVQMSLAFLDVLNVSLKIGEYTQLLGSIFPLPGAKNHPQESPCIIW